MSLGMVFGVLEGLGEVFLGWEELLETCLDDLGDLLWIHGCFFGLLGGPWCDFGCPWGPFGRLLGGGGGTFGSLWVAGDCFFSGLV